MAGKPSTFGRAFQEREIEMYLRKRIETLEAALAPSGKAVVFWAMVGDRAMTDHELRAEIEHRQSESPGTRFVPVAWL